MKRATYGVLLIAALSIAAGLREPVSEPQRIEGLTRIDPLGLARADAAGIVEGGSAWPS